MNKVINIKYFRFLLSLVMIFGTYCIQNSLKAGIGSAIIKGLEETADRLTTYLEDDAAKSLERLQKELTETQINALIDVIEQSAKEQDYNYYVVIDDFIKLKSKSSTEYEKAFKDLVAKNTQLSGITTKQFDLFLDAAEKELAIDESLIQSLAEFITDLKIVLEKFLGRESSDVVRDLRAVDTATANKILNDVLQKLPDTTQKDLETFVSKRKIKVSFENQSAEYQDMVNRLAKTFSLDAKEVDSLIDMVTPAINQLK